MAHFHMRLKVPKGIPAPAKLSYLSGEGKKSDVVEVQNFNIDFEPSEFWNAAEENERANCKVKYREYQMMLPSELSHEQHQELMQDFITHEKVDLTNHPMTIAYHKGDRGDQPHAHLMFSERENDGLKRESPALFFKRFNSKNPELGGCKKQSQKFRGIETGIAIKAAFAEVQNDFFKKVGLDISVSHLSFKAQGIDKVPQKSYGYKIGAMLKNGVDVTKSAIVKYNNLAKETNLQRQIVYQHEQAKAIQLASLLVNPTLQSSTLEQIEEINVLKADVAKLGETEIRKPIYFESLRDLMNKGNPDHTRDYKSTKLQRDWKSEEIKDLKWYQFMQKPALENELQELKEAVVLHKNEAIEKAEDLNASRKKSYKFKVSDLEFKLQSASTRLEVLEAKLENRFGLKSAELKLEIEQSDVNKNLELDRQREQKMEWQQLEQSCQSNGSDFDMC